MKIASEWVICALVIVLAVATCRACDQWPTIESPALEQPTLVTTVTCGGPVVGCYGRHVTHRFGANVGWQRNVSVQRQWRLGPVGATVHRKACYGWPPVLHLNRSVKRYW